MSYERVTGMPLSAHRMLEHTTGLPVEETLALSSGTAYVEWTRKEGSSGNNSSIPI
jgi:hypothetical protein